MSQDDAGCSILADIGSSTPHERFSLMLQERLDVEITKMHQVIKQVSMQVQEMQREVECVRLSQKQAMLRSCLQYYMDMFPNEMEHPLHYIRCLKNDLQEFIKSKEDVIKKSNDDAVVHAAFVSAVCRPFLSARRNKCHLSQAEATDTSAMMHHIELESSLAAVADLCVKCPNDFLMEFLCEAVDMPDLMGL